MLETLLYAKGSPLSKGKTRPLPQPRRKTATCPPGRPAFRHLTTITYRNHVMPKLALGLLYPLPNPRGMTWHLMNAATKRSSPTPSWSRTCFGALSNRNGWATSTSDKPLPPRRTRPKACCSLPKPCRHGLKSGLLTLKSRLRASKSEVAVIVFDYQNVSR